MAMNEERIKKLSEVLNADVEQAKQVVAMQPEEAVKLINAKGYDFTVEELVEYGTILRKMAEADSLSEEDLEKVAGGIDFVVIGATFVGTVLFNIGRTIGKNAPW